MAPHRVPARTLRLLAGVVAALAVVLPIGWSAPVATAGPAAPAAPAAATAPAVPAAPAQESTFVSRINSFRASKGLNQLAVSGELTGVARSWANHMAQQGQISHNPNLGSQVGGAWTKLGENVGVGYDVDGLMNAFINSPAHYANLVDPAWTHVGVGVVMGGDGRMYTTHNFMALGSAPPPPPPPPPPTTAPPPPSGGNPPPSGGNPPSGGSPTTTAAPGPTTTTTAPPQPEPTEERVTAVLDPLRDLEQA